MEEADEFLSRMGRCRCEFPVWHLWGRRESGAAAREKIWAGRSVNLRLNDNVLVKSNEEI